MTLDHIAGLSQLPPHGVVSRFMQQLGMSHDNSTSPYTLEVRLCEKPAGHFQWAIRKHGKLVERSDRAHSSERSAQESGQAALERQLRDDREPKRGFRPQQQTRTGQAVFETHGLVSGASVKRRLLHAGASDKGSYHTL